MEIAFVCTAVMWVLTIPFCMFLEKMGNNTVNGHNLSFFEREK